MDKDTSDKSTRGRKALPDQLRQSGMIRERVTPGIEELYTKLGGKLFMLEVLKLRARDYRQGRRVKATFVPQAWVDDHAVDVDAEGPTTFDVTHIILAMGKEAALQIQDNRDSSDVLRESDTAPSWIVNWQGPFVVRVEESIKDYFEE